MVESLPVPPAPPRRRSTGELEPHWVSARRRQRHRLLLIGTVLLVVAVFVDVLLVARANYLDGKRALRTDAYLTAVGHLRSATVLGVSYHDARSLLGQASTLARVEAEYGSAMPGSAPAAASRLLERAAGLFTAGHPDQAEALIAGRRLQFSSDVLLSRLASGHDAVAAVLLLAGADQALATGDWQAAASQAQSVLARYPGCAPAAALAAVADRRVRAEPFARRGLALAHGGHWRLALTALHRALAIDPTYPAAAAFSAHVQTELRHQVALAKRRAAARQAAARRAAALRAAAARRAAALRAAAAAASAPVTIPRPVITSPPPP